MDGSFLEQALSLSSGHFAGINLRTFWAQGLAHMWYTIEGSVRPDEGAWPGTVTCKARAHKLICTVMYHYTLEY